MEAQYIMKRGADTQSNEPDKNTEKISRQNIIVHSQSQKGKDRGGIVKIKKTQTFYSS